MKAHRSWKEVDVNVAFSVQLMVWWASLQPSNIVNGAKADWTTLRKTGKNGLFLILLGLVWWGHSTIRKVEWDAAVSDITRSIQYMRESISSGTETEGRTVKGKTMVVVDGSGRSKQGQKENEGGQSLVKKARHT